MMNWLQKLRDLWADLSQNQRILFGSLGAGFVVLFGLLLNWAADPDYAVLYANLDAGDAGQIVERLRSDGIPYQVDGNTVRVPRDRVHETRIFVAKEGLPSSGTGYELMDSSKLGWTDFVQKFQHRRALEGEIARTVQTLDEVQSARVHLVTPERSLFIKEEKPATASVVLALQSGHRLNPGQVAGIVHLVSSAVEGLDHENVTLLDAAGVLLSSPQDSDLLGVTSDQISLVNAKEEELTRKVESLLERVLGPGKSVVRIAVDMDFEQSESTVESYDADNPVVVSEDRSESTGADGSVTESGVTNYEISKRTERTSKPAGSLQRLTASVFIDGTYAETDDGTRSYVPRTEEEMQKFTGIIQTAIGFDPARGDQLTVEDIAFDNSAQEEVNDQMATAHRNRMLLDVGSQVGSIAIVGVLLFFLVRVLRRSELFSPTEPPEAESSEEGAAGAVTGSDFLMDAKDTEQLQLRVVELARSKPEEVGRLLRSWMKEEAL